MCVDGRLAGQTPANVASLAAGEHRVRIVKSGYLENARVVTLTAGEPSHLERQTHQDDGRLERDRCGSGDVDRRRWWRIEEVVVDRSWRARALLRW